MLRYYRNRRTSFPKSTLKIKRKLSRRLKVGEISQRGFEKTLTNRISRDLKLANHKGAAKEDPGDEIDTCLPGFSPGRYFKRRENIGDAFDTTVSASSPGSSRRSKWWPGEDPGKQ